MTVDHLKMLQATGGKGNYNTETPGTGGSGMKWAADVRSFVHPRRPEDVHRCSVCNLTDAEQNRHPVDVKCWSAHKEVLES